MTTKIKLGRNDVCNCGSGKKFKKCCDGKEKEKEEEKYKKGQLTSSEKIRTTMEAFKIMYENHMIIDISNDLTDSNYKKYQIKNYHEKVIMLAEKNSTNEKVFETRARDDTSDIMIMYKGSYRTLPFDDLGDLMKSICEMIDESDER